MREKKTREKYDARKDGEYLTIPRNTNEDTTNEDRHAEPDNVAALKRHIAEQARKIEILTKERDEASGDNTALRFELEKIKKELTICKSENIKETSNDSVIGKRKARKKRRVSNEDGTRESTTFVPAEEDKGEQTIETKKQVEQAECQSGKFDLTVI